VAPCCQQPNLTNDRRNLHVFTYRTIDTLNLWVNILKLKQLAVDTYQVLAVMEGERCPALDFLTDGEETTRSSREGLGYMLGKVAEMGFDKLPTKWCHEANKNDQIYEFIKGDLRLFYFKGVDNEIAVCSGGVMKKGKKVDKASVAKAIAMKKAYWAAKGNNTCEVIQDEAR
jgi:hypothetical protein